MRRRVIIIVYPRMYSTIFPAQGAEMKDKKVFVAGCGGLGCYEVELLARLGVGEIIVADGDRFSPGNMNRQLYCLPGTIGRYKAEVASERWPGTVKGICDFITEKNAAELIRGADLVVDALDTAQARRTLASACEAEGITMIHGAIGDTNAQCCVIFPGDLDILETLYPAEPDRVATASYTPAFCASMQISLAARLLRGEKIKRRSLYLADLEGLEISQLSLPCSE